MKLKLLLLITLLPWLGYAQTGKVWTLEQCINQALKNNIQIKQSELNTRQNQLALQSAQYSRIPTLNGSSSFSFNTGRSINPFTNTIETDDITSQRYNISSSVTLFNYFSITNSIKQSKIDVDRSVYDLEDTKNVTILNIVTFYTNILLNEEQVANAELAIETSKLQLDRTKKQFDAGAVARQNLLQIEQQLANDELSLVRAENALNLAKLNLQQAMQIPTTNDFQVQIPELPDPTGQLVIGSPRMIYEQAMSVQPNIKSADASVESSEYDVKITEANYYPSLTLNAGIGTSYSSLAPDQIPAAGADNIIISQPIGVVDGTGQIVSTETSIPATFTDNTYFNQLDFNRNTFVSLNLNIPIFNGLQAKNGVANAKINLERAKLNALNERNLLRQNIEQVYQDAVAASKSWEAANNQVAALEESFRNVERRFNLGSSDPVEYNQIKNDLNRAKSDLIRAKYDFIFKLKILDFYQGKTLSLD